MAFINIDNVSFEYKTKVCVLNDIDWNIQRGEFHSLIGRSGCGKTTLLKIIAGLLVPTNGKVVIGDIQVLRPSDKVGFVFQTPNLLEWLSVIDNVLLPIAIRENKNQQHIDFALELLATVGLKYLSDYYPTELSGGQQSRVAIARALMTNPFLLLMDEPFAALDAMTREELQIDLLKLCWERGTTVLFITHDISEAVYLSDKIAVMGEGFIQDQFTIDISKPRENKLRYETSFNNMCSKIYNSMKNPTFQNQVDS